MHSKPDYRQRALEPLEAFHQREYENDAWTFEKWVSLCESPIEYILAGYLYSADIFGHRFKPCGTVEVGHFTDWREANSNRFNENLASEGRQYEVWPQAIIGEYRVDFLIVAGPRLSNGELVHVAIECDGHDYHERTKEQAARDRARDRALQAAGMHVFRFTGSEIYRDPQRCLSEIAVFLEERVPDDEAFFKLRHAKI